MFIRFDVINERDRRTDAQTLHDSIDRACIASRGKNVGCGMGKRKFFALVVRITGKLLNIDG